MISVIVPTCNRPELFKNMLDSLKRTTQGFEVECIAVIDKDKESYQIAIDNGCWTIFSDSMRGAIECWNIGLKMCHGDLIVPAGDDQIFYDDWLKYAIESHIEKLNSYGVIGMNDLAYNGNSQLATMFLFDRQYCKDHMGGVIAPPVYNYYCVDSEINAKAKSLNMFYWDERSTIEHLHPAHGKREKDEHDLLREKNNLMEIDNKIFEERKARGFPITWESLI
jgi:glycosyltransferase involved in cell wall biosynthesis